MKLSGQTTMQFRFQSHNKGILSEKTLDQWLGLGSSMQKTSLGRGGHPQVKGTDTHDKWYKFNTLTVVQIKIKYDKTDMQSTHLYNG